MRRLPFACLVLALAISSLLHAIPTMNGENDENWDERHYSVIRRQGAGRGASAGQHLDGDARADGHDCWQV